MTKRLGNWVSAVAATALIAVALAGCGNTPGSSVGARGGKPVSSQSGAASAGPALCREPAAVAQARVTQLGGLPALSASHQDAPGPSGVVTGVVARSLARAVCSLPPMPRGTFHCPALLADSYRLVFVAAGRFLPAVTVQATGCRQVTGLGHVRWAEHSEALLEELARMATGTQ